MSSWVYVLSKFTNELLVFELAAIFSLLAAYLGFWVLRKRKLGTIDEAVPSGMVKLYLNELIQQAQVLRTQLFGLLGHTEIPGETLRFAVQPHHPGDGPLLASASAQIGAQAANDPELQKKLALLEMKLLEQTSAVDLLETEKKRIADELAAMKNAAKAGATSGGGADVQDFKKKIQELEDKLAEYSVIEDDLANLKRLQQENAQLRSALQGAGVSIPDAAAAPATGAAVAAAAGVATAAVESAPAQQKQPSPEETQPAPEAAQEPAASPEPKPAATQEPAFEGLAENVAASLPNTDPTKTGSPEPAMPQSTTPEPTAAASPPKENKSDEDLLSEFEKMLNMS